MQIFTFLVSLGIKWLYFSNHDLEKVIAYLNNCLLILSGDDLGQVKIRLTLLTEHLQLTLRQSLHAPAWARTYAPPIVKSAGSSRNCKKISRPWA